MNLPILGLRSRLCLMYVSWRSHSPTQNGSHSVTVEIAKRGKACRFREQEALLLFLTTSVAFQTRDATNKAANPSNPDNYRELNDTRQHRMSCWIDMVFRDSAIDGSSTNYDKCLDYCHNASLNVPIFNGLPTAVRP